MGIRKPATLLTPDSGCGERPTNSSVVRWGCIFQ
jgi:hypothetical protein